MILFLLLVLCIPVSSISRPRSFVFDPRVVRACVSSRARARKCHITQTRKPLKNAREMALFGARDKFFLRRTSIFNIYARVDRHVCFFFAASTGNTIQARSSTRLHASTF